MGPILVLAGLGLGALILSTMKKGPRAADDTIAEGKPYLPAEAFGLLGTNPDGSPSPLSGAWAFKDQYAEIAAAKLLRYKVASRTTRTLPGGGGAVEIIRGTLAFRKKIEDGGLPKNIDDTMLGAARTSKSITNTSPSGTSAGLASKTLALVPNGVPVDAILFRTVMNDLRLFPDSVTLVIGDPAVLRTLATGSVTATTTALGLNTDLVVITRDLGAFNDFPVTTQDLINKMAES